MITWSIFLKLLSGLGSWIVNAASSIGRAVLGLPLAGKLGLALAVSGACNAWQWHHAGTLRARVAATAALYQKASEAADKKGKEVHDQKQGILDFLVQRDNQDRQARIQSIESKATEAKVRYEKVFVPLPADCRYPDDVVRAANQTIRGFSTGTVRH